MRPAVVKRISQDAGGVTVTTAAGDAFRAPYVIVTLPLGVLKDAGGPGSVAFDPPLPAAKAQAVADMVSPPAR